MASRPPGHCSQAATDRVGGLRSSVKVPSVVMSHTTGWRFGLTLGLPCAPVRLRLLGHRMWTLRETSDGFTCNLAVSRRRGLRSGEGYRLAPGGSCALFLNRFCLSSSRINYMASLPPPSHRPPPPHTPPHSPTFWAPAGIVRVMQPQHQLMGGSAAPTRLLPLQATVESVGCPREPATLLPHSATKPRVFSTTSSSGSLTCWKGSQNLGRHFISCCQRKQGNVCSL